MNRTGVLSVYGTGVVTPAGNGVKHLLQSSSWPTSEMAGIASPDEKKSVFKIAGENARLKRWQLEARTRRASPLTIYLAEAVAQALEGTTADSGRIGLVAAYSTGSLIYSVKFYTDILKKGRAAASPALFPETVYNSPTSHLATLFGISGPSYSLVGDESSWVEALRVAALWLDTMDLDYVLVVAAEELDSAVLDAYRVSGWLQHAEFIPTEGAGALLVGRSETGKPQIKAGDSTYWYRNKQEAKVAAAHLLAETDSSLPVLAYAGGTWLEKIEQAALNGRQKIHRFPGCGNAFTCSMAWHTIRALSLSDENQPVVVPVWGLNSAFSCLQIKSV